MRYLGFPTIIHWYILLVCLGLFVHAITNPLHNLDILGYAASAVSIENSDAGYIHNYVYDELKASATNEAYTALSENHSYREIMLNDADAFNQQIPFYKIRIIFVLLIYSLAELGVNIFFAAHLLSAFLTSMGVLVFYHAYRKIIQPAFWLVIPVFLVGFSVDELAKLVTADSLAFFWLGLICYAFMHSRWRVLFVLLFSSVLIRTDMIFLVALLLAYLIIFRPELRLGVIVTGLISVVLYFFINNYAGNYGWSTVFYYAVISNMRATHPLEYSSLGISVEQYLSAVKGNMWVFLHNKDILLFEFVVFAQFLFHAFSLRNKKSFKEVFASISNNAVFVLTVISVFYVIIHYAVFPLMFVRFFVGYYLIAALGLLAVISSCFPGKSELRISCKT